MPTFSQLRFHRATVCAALAATLLSVAWLSGCSSSSTTVARGRMFVGNDTGVSVIDTEELSPVAQIPLRGPEIAMSVDAARHELDVLTGGDGALVTVGIERAATTFTLGLGAKPTAMSRAPGTSLAYVATTRADGASEILVVDLAADVVRFRRHIASPAAALAITADGQRLLAALPGVSRIDIFRLPSLAAAGTVLLEEPVEQLTALPFGNEVFARSARGRHVAVLDAKRAGLLTYLTVGEAPADMVAKPDGGEVYVSNPQAGTVSVINTATLEVATSMWAGRGASGMCVSPDGATLFVANTAADTVSVIELANRQTVAAVAVGSRPVRVQLSPSGRFVFAEDAGSNDISVVRLDTQAPQPPALATLLPAPVGPRDMLTVSLRP